MILATILGLGVLGQTALPGDGMGLDEARAKARLVVVARPVGGLVAGSGSVFFGTLNLKHSAVLKGDLKKDDLKRVSISGSGRETVPKQGEEHLFFINDFQDHLHIIKVLPATPENIGSATRPAAKSENAGARIYDDEE